MQAISSFIPFPPISWCAQALQATTIIFDKAEHFEKMSYRNRYTISGANNVNQLSIPLVKGRNQRITMGDVLIHNEEKWQVQHWRTLTSVYKRSPYWEYYEQSLQVLFDTPFNHLIDFNLATVQWLFRQLKAKTAIEFATTYQASYPADFIALRNLKPSQDRQNDGSFPKYYQVFEDRIGFIPNLSILDLLFAEGPATMLWLTNFTGAVSPK